MKALILKTTIKGQVIIGHSMGNGISEMMEAPTRAMPKQTPIVWNFTLTGPHLKNAWGKLEEEHL